MDMMCKWIRTEDMETVIEELRSIVPNPKSTTGIIHSTLRKFYLHIWECFHVNLSDAYVAKEVVSFQGARSINA